MDNNNQFSPDRKRSNYKNRFNFYMNDRNNNNDYSLILSEVDASW